MTQQSRWNNLHSGITRVGYDANNQPDSVTFSTGESIRYYYDGMGNRLGTDEYTAFMPVYLQGAANTLINDEDREVLRRRYCGNFVYEDGILQRVLVEGGFITLSNGTPQYHFYLKDHLGSNRVVTDADGNIEEYNHYYPYGALMNISSASTQPYKYNGKELNRLNRLLWYDQSARQYNPILGRFMSMDPLCEKYYSISPYAFCANNPVKYVDLDGRDYRLKFDLESRTVTVYANFEVAEGAEELFKATADFWNNLNYEIDGYNVNFNITSEADANGGYLNTFSVVGTEGETNDCQTQIGGCDGKNVRVYKGGDKNTASHEVGHSIGLIHYDEYSNSDAVDHLMYYTQSGRQGTKVEKSEIKDILRCGMNGKPNEDYDKVDGEKRFTGACLTNKKIVKENMAKIKSKVSDFKHFKRQQKLLKKQK